jgi:hypothetical protein
MFAGSCAEHVLVMFEFFRRHTRISIKTRTQTNKIHTNGFCGVSVLLLLKGLNSRTPTVEKCPHNSFSLEPRAVVQRLPRWQASSQVAVGCHPRLCSRHQFVGRPQSRTTTNSCESSWMHKSCALCPGYEQTSRCARRAAEIHRAGSRLSVLRHWQLWIDSAFVVGRHRCSGARRSNVRGTESCQTPAIAAKILS